MTSVKRRIFVSYRRDDSDVHAGWLAKTMRDKQAGDVFLDVDGISLGEDFKERIDREINLSDVVLVLIGRAWLTLRDDEGKVRLQDELDWVHLEVRAALARGSLVVPVLLDGARMPKLQELPDPLRGLTFRHGMSLRASNWDMDVQQLVDNVAGARVPDHGQIVGDGPERSLGGVDRRAVLNGPSVLPANDSSSAGEMGRAIRALVPTMPAEFQTKDVSESSAVVVASGPRGRAGKHHASVGSYISRHRLALAVESLGPSTNGRGEHWHRVDVEPIAARPPDKAVGSRTAGTDQGRWPTSFPSKITSAYIQQEVPTLDRQGLLLLIAEVLRRGWPHDDVYDWMMGHSPLKPARRLPERISLDWLASNVALLSPSRVDKLVGELRRRGWSEFNIRRHVLSNRQAGLAGPTPARVATGWIEKNAPLMTADEHDKLAKALQERGYSARQIRKYAPYAGMPTRSG